jgi:hypothetical protein
MGGALHGELFDRDVAWRFVALFAPLQLDYAVAPRLSWRAMWGQELTIGAEVLYGPAGTLGGFFSKASRLYMEWRLVF